MKYKRLFVLLLFFLIWGILFSLIVQYENDKNSRAVSQYVVINSFDVWKYSNFKWSKFDYAVDFDAVNEEINSKKYNIYVNNYFYKKLTYYIRDGEEYFFDDNIHSYNISQEKIMFNASSYFQLKKFDSRVFSDDDLEYVSNVLSKYHHFYDNINVNKKYFINDNNIIYIISNYPSNYVDDDKLDFYYFVFYKRGNKNYVLVDLDYHYHISDYMLKWVIDIKNNNFLNFVLSYKCEETVCYDMFQYQKGKYERVVGTLEEINEL